MTTRSPLQIFLSCGRTYTKTQEDFVQALEAFLKSRNCQYITLGRNYQPIDQPAKAARDLIGKCDGMVVVAFERIRALSVRSEGSSTASDAERSVRVVGAGD